MSVTFFPDQSVHAGYDWVTVVVGVERMDGEVTVRFRSAPRKALAMQ